MEHLDRARALRDNTEVHYNCCQAVLIPFARELGLTEERAYALGAHFGSGMRHGGTCGALSGALMVLGLLGYDDKAALELIGQFQQGHQATDCASLLQTAQDRGIPRKENCDGLVFKMIRGLESCLEGKR